MQFIKATVGVGHTRRPSEVIASAVRARWVRPCRAVSVARPASCTLVKPSTRDLRLGTAATHLMLASAT